MVPLIPLLFTGAGIASLLGLIWYDNLSTEQKRIANGHAARLAQEMYQQQIDQLTRSQLNHVLQEVKGLTGF